MIDRRNSYNVGGWHIDVPPDQNKHEVWQGIRASTPHTALYQFATWYERQHGKLRRGQSMVVQITRTA